MATDSSVNVVAMAWYRREDYAAIRRIMVDSEALPATFDKWFYLADKNARELQRRGFRVERVYIDPQTFPSWCAAKDMEMNASARSAFASEYAREQHEG